MSSCSPPNVDGHHEFEPHSREKNRNQPNGRLFAPWQVYLLAVVIAGFSGAWPYVKLALLAACWTTPARTMPLRRRQRLLLWLEALGKWSLIDTFVLVMMMVAFKFHLALSKVRLGIELGLGLAKAKVRERAVWRVWRFRVGVVQGTECLWRLCRYWVWCRVVRCRVAPWYALEWLLGVVSSGSWVCSRVAPGCVLSSGSWVSSRVAPASPHARSNAPTEHSTVATPT